MQVEELVKAKVRRQLTPFECQQLLELSQRHGIDRLSRAITRLHGRVDDPVRSLTALVQRLARKRCRQCSYTWDAERLGIYACPRCQIGIVGSDGQIDRVKYEAYMRQGRQNPPVCSEDGRRNPSHDETLEIGQNQARTVSDISNRIGNTTSDAILTATGQGQLYENQREKHSP